MKMKMSSGVQIALGLGAILVIYLVIKNNQATSSAVPSGSANNPQLVPIGGGSPISSAGMVSVDVQPPLVPLQLSFN
jgi:hypothetical protein